MRNASRVAVPSSITSIANPARPACSGASVEWPASTARVRFTIGVLWRSISMTFIPFESVARSTAGNRTSGAFPSGGSTVRSAIVLPAASWGIGLMRSVYEFPESHAWAVLRTSSGVAAASVCRRSR
jgi:hypothetical protein